MPRFTGPLVTKDTSRGVHVRALWWALTELLDTCKPASRARLRTVRAMLERAYIQEFATDSDIAQALAEEDGDAVSEEP